jgi:hypothetical protein
MTGASEMQSPDEFEHYVAVIDGLAKQLNAWNSLRDSVFLRPRRVGTGILAENT